MSARHGLVNTVHLTALALWLGTTIGSGAAAAAIFPTMKALDVRLPGFEQAPDQWRIAGGMIAQRVFLIADFIQFPCAFIAAATLGIMILWQGLPTRSLTTIIRCLALSLALAALASLLLIVTPALTQASQQHWQAAKVGDAAAAATHKAAIDDLHPIATGLSIGMAVSTSVALAAGACSISVPGPGIRVRLGNDGHA